MWRNYLKAGDLIWLDDGRSTMGWLEMDKLGFGTGEPVIIPSCDVAMFLSELRGRNGYKWDKVLYGDRVIYVLHGRLVKRHEQSV